MRRIPLSQGKFALVDDADFGWLSQWNWYAAKDRGRGFYARRNRQKGEALKSSSIKMHRVLLGLDDDEEEGDHRDGDGLNNRRRNLRRATQIENSRNRVKQPNHTSFYKGVTWNKKNQKWCAQISRGPGKSQHIGLFESEIKAAKAYDNEAVTIFREFARLNFPTPV